MSRKSYSFWFWHEVLEEFWCFRLRILDEILMLLIEKHAPWKECKERVSTLLMVVFLFFVLRGRSVDDWCLAPWKEFKERVSTLLIVVFLFRALRPLCCVDDRYFFLLIATWNIKCIWLQSWLRSELHRQPAFSRGCDQNCIVCILTYSLTAFANICSSNFLTIPTSVHPTFLLCLLMQHITCWQIAASWKRSDPFVS